MDRKDLPEAPDFEGAAARVISLSELQRHGPVVLAFFDSRGSDF